MSARTVVTFASVCNRQILEAGINLLNQTKKTQMELVYHPEKAAIRGWNGAIWNDSKTHYEIRNTGTSGTIGILIFDDAGKEGSPNEKGDFVGTTKLVGDHIYIDQALGRNGAHLHAACDAARHIMIAQSQHVPVTRVEYVAAKNEYLVECEVG
jgi:hypothetical protein